MTLEALSNLAKIGKVKAEPMNRAEIDRMLVMARKRLADSSYPKVSQSPCRGSGLYFNLENALKVKTLLLALLVCMPFSTLAQHSHAGQTPYAGMQNRAIKSLSDNDINELRRGGGWGLALAAELNGMPGPAHLLELKDKIPLTADQVDKTQALLDEMRKAAIPAGERLIAAEKALEAAFASGKVDESSLRRLLADAESARSELRFIHLSQHYKTVLFLKPEQIKRYNILRGYADDPCQNIPAGHNPEMYKRHMRCN